MILALQNLAAPPVVESALRYVVEGILSFKTYTLSSVLGSQCDAALQTRTGTERDRGGAVPASAAEGKGAAGPPQRPKQAGSGARSGDSGPAAVPGRQGAGEPGEGWRAGRGASARL